ncbi:hypothetical protein ACQKLP_05510 [Chitinophaga sp. NPDC101104]|uniref:hypothetical protein n=1 Tax=Chitinophaga sp. NPDC101104 TaxID=3390561 RepID=UPI003D03A276
MLPIKKHYKIRHKILETLYLLDNETTCAKEIHFNEIYKRLPHTDKIYLLDNLQFLIDAKEITCNKKYDDSLFLILGNGRSAFIERKYLIEGRKKSLEHIYDNLKVVSTAVLLIIAVSTFLVNIMQTQENKNQINQVKTRIDSLKMNFDNGK